MEFCFSLQSSNLKHFKLEIEKEKKENAQVFRVSHVFRSGRFMFIAVLELGFGCNGTRVIGFLQFEHSESIRFSLLVCPTN